jgi:hypothetical protein
MGSAKGRIPLHWGRRPWYESIPGLDDRRRLVSETGFPVSGGEWREVGVVADECDDFLFLVVYPLRGG